MDNLRNGHLGLNFPSLTGLGGRIDSARLAADPVGLAVAASELEAAEAASGKTAKITSAALKKEAQELAILRRQPAELRAIAKLDPSQEKKLTALAKEAETELNQAREVRASAGEKITAPGRGPGFVDLINDIPSPALVHINGVLTINVPAHQRRSIPIFGIGKPTAISIDWPPSVVVPYWTHWRHYWPPFDNPQVYHLKASIAAQP